MSNDLISREALKKAVENLVAGGEERLKDYYENGSKSEENEWIGGVYDAWELIRNAPTVERPQGDLISRMWLKEHKFTTQVCNGVEIEDVDVVAIATIDNAPTVVNEYTKGFADGERSGDLLRQQCEKPLKQKKDSHQEYWDHIGEETNNELLSLYRR